MVEKFLSHALSGLFVSAFGMAFLGLTVWRLVRLMATMAMPTPTPTTPIHLLGSGCNSNEIENCNATVVDGRRNHNRNVHHRQRQEQRQQQRKRCGDSAGERESATNTSEAKEEDTTTQYGHVHTHNHNEDDDDDVPSEYELLLREFLRRHVPERSPRVLWTTSAAMAGSCVFGIVYTMFGARFIHHDLHPSWGVFHYVSHLALLGLFLFVGWTGLLEAYSFLPSDAMRAATALALWGEALLWIQHGASKDNDLDATLHYALGGISCVTAVCMTASVLVVSLGRERSQHQQHQHHYPSTYSFLLYVAAFVGLVWQGLWFLTIAWYLRGWVPIPSTGHATALVVAEGLLLVVLCQGMVVVLVQVHAHVHSRRKRQQRRRRLTSGFAGSGSGSGSGKNHHESHSLVARFEDEDLDGDDEYDDDDDETIMPSELDRDEEQN